MVAQSLFLANLMIAPGLAFLVLLWLYRRRKNSLGEQALNHLCWAINAPLFGGVLLMGEACLILFVGGFGSVFSCLALLL